MNEHLEQLAPASLWRHFRTFCETPRPSWHETELIQTIEHWADTQGLAHERDAVGNVLLRKPVSPGHETAPGVILQGHLDMVCETESSVDHDFYRDPIETKIDNGWLTASGTTLGADNGVGAAAALAVLENDALIHGPLEVLLTVAEEVSLAGASQLETHWLRGGYLLNLDTEQAGDVTIGCAGGAVIAAETYFDIEPIAADEAVFDLTVDGLIGGHSGMDIHMGRANANVLLARVLLALQPCTPRLIEYTGGQMDNAITRSAHVRIAVPAAGAGQIEATVAELETVLRREWTGIENNMEVSVERVTLDNWTGNALTATASRQSIDLLASLPYGVERMSNAAPGVVETSNNLGLVHIAEGRFTARLLVRSLTDSARDALADRIRAHFDLAGIKSGVAARYSGWTPNPNSVLLDHFERIHQSVTGDRPARQVLHAGLECGLIGAKYPDLEMISFGPTIHGAHSPDERVELTSVESFYAVLEATVAELASVEN